MFAYNRNFFEATTFDWYRNLLDSCLLYPLAENQLSGVLVFPTKENKIPLVRTTIKRDRPVQYFKSIHRNLMDRIRREFDGRFFQPISSFNTALIDVYSNHTSNEKFHSFQCQDLCVQSFICIFSCFSAPSESCREIVFSPKKGGQLVRFKLSNNSVVLLPYQTNLDMMHKVVGTNDPGTNWLCLVFMLSKSFLEFVDHFPYLRGVPFRAASVSEEMVLKKKILAEDRSTRFIYRKSYFTISIADLLDPNYHLRYDRVPIDYSKEPLVWTCDPFDWTDVDRVDFCAWCQYLQHGVEENIFYLRTDFGLQISRFKSVEFGALLKKLNDVRKIKYHHDLSIFNKIHVLKIQSKHVFDIEGVFCICSVYKNLNLSINRGIVKIETDKNNLFNYYKRGESNDRKQSVLRTVKFELKQNPARVEHLPAKLKYILYPNLTLFVSDFLNKNYYIRLGAEKTDFIQNIIFTIQ